ncbi:MAG TPA: TonB C-terminal domain-containing protein [Blastocatellia bacterium]|nr:TonB C-terminal domain-containing protein [Blastocatellia bacterium]
MNPQSSNSRRTTTRERLGLVASIALHILVLGGLFVSFQRLASQEIVAAGPGEGGEGGGGAVQVGVADKNAILGFAQPQPVSYVGDSNDAINNARLEHQNREEDPKELLPPTEREQPTPDTVKTDRPVANQHEKIFTGKEERGRSVNQSAQVGRTYGTPTPASMIGGVGIGSGGSGVGTGLPGGSEYGRRIQAILSRNFNPPAGASDSVQYVVIVIKIARDGRILSISNGRISPAYIKQRSQNSQVNYAAERAVLAADPLPPFPAGFLTGASEASAEVWFRYPK